MHEALRIAVVGHTNAGKTSLLRTLTRRVDFGQVSDRPGTTRHAEAVELRLDGRLVVRFVDTPGLEDSVALLQFLSRQPGDSRPERVRAFLAGPEARASFEQEAKVLRALLDQADCAMLVIDTRQPVLPKYRAEIEILVACARPIMPVLNFVRDGASRLADWHTALQEAGLHARAEFDVVAPFVGSEREL
ncbi:MAG TPA: GTPase domain-containing protein, partial [Ottowia sp.]|nr:GTPase domain-containing protein [Ottowia sp.]